MSEMHTGEKSNGLGLFHGGTYGVSVKLGQRISEGPQNQTPEHATLAQSVDPALEVLRFELDLDHEAT